MFFRKKKVTGPDYLAVDSREKALALVARGELVAMLLLPEAFGGEVRTENTVYVPPFVAELKSEADRNIILPLAAEGKISRYRAEPEYAGRSVVPIAVRLVGFDPANFTYDIAIWGDALGRATPPPSS